MEDLRRHSIKNWEGEIKYAEAEHREKAPLYAINVSCCRHGMRISSSIGSSRQHSRTAGRAAG